MEIPMKNSLPNFDDMDEVINSLWDEKPKRDFSEDQIASITQWLLDGAPSIVPEESAKVSKKDDNTIPKTIQDLAQSALTDSDAMQKNKIAFSSEILTPEASPPMWYAYLSDNPIDDPVPSCMLSPKSQPAVMACFTHNQSPSSSHIQLTSSDPKAYEMYDIDISMKQIEEDIQRNWPGAVQNVEIEPLHELQPVRQACLKPAPSQVVHEQPLNKLMIPPNTKNLGNQQGQDSLTIAIPPTSGPCYDPISPYDAAELAPFKNSASYVSSLHFAFEDSDTLEHGSGYSMPSSNYGQSPTFNIVDQAATHSDSAVPASGNSIVYPVQFDAPQPMATEKSATRKRPWSLITAT